MSGLLNNPFTKFSLGQQSTGVRYPTRLEIVKVQSLLMGFPPNGHMTNREGYRQVSSVYTSDPQMS